MEKNHSKTTQLLAILVLAVFGFCVLMLLLASASVYQNLVDAGEVEFHRRTALGYLTTRVRQADSVRIEEFEDQEVLVLEEILEGEICLTRVYCHEGFLRELYTVPGALVAAEDGEPILEAEYLRVSLEGNLLTVFLNEEKLLLYIPQGTEVGP